MELVDPNWYAEEILIQDSPAEAGDLNPAVNDSSTARKIPFRFILHYK